MDLPRQLQIAFELEFDHTFVEQAGALDSDGGLGGNGAGNLLVVVIESAFGRVKQLQHADQLIVEPDQGHSPSELSELIARNIPAVTLGITHGTKSHKAAPDYVLIDPILTGVAQLVGVILAIDEGVCDEV